MKLRLVALVAGAAMIAAACGGGGDDDDSAAEGPSPTPTAESTPEPTTEPTPESTPEPTPEPTEEPTPEPTPEPEPFYWDSLEVGSCWNDPEDYDNDVGYEDVIETIDCAEVHTNQAFAFGTYADDGDYPGEDALSSYAFAEVCDPAYAELLSIPEGQYPIEYFTTYPDEETWALGDRRIVCALEDPSGFIGPIASAGLDAPELIVFYVARVDDQVDLYLKLPGEEPINYTNDADEEDDVPPSVSEQSLAVFGRFFDDEGLDTDIWSVDLLTGVQSTILDSVADEALPRIRNDGSRIVYISDEGTDEYDIWSMNPDGSDRVRLTDNPDRDSNPAWSPDGSQIVYRARIDGNSDIWIMNADGTDKRQLTDDPGGDYDPVFSPDGTKIAFTSDRTGDFEIWVMDVDGSNQTNLTNHPADDEYPQWTSDSNGIGFTSTRWSTSQWLMRADGSEQTLFLPQPLAAYGVFSGPLP